MATVYRARDTRLDRWVAVKVMHPHLRGTEEARARFAREARAVARLKHASILEIYDYSGHDSDNAYIATELLTGPTLRVFIDKVGEIPAEIAACIGVQLAAALGAAHTHGIVHRDVKPENVLLHEQRSLKLTDFGIADMLDPTMSAMTATGQLLGSPAHMAPEQVESGDADARSDVFALGTILYWLTTGVLPFSGKNPHQVLKRVVDCNPVDPLTLRPSMGRPLRAVIMRCLAKAPADRFQTAAALANELERVLKASGVDDPDAALEAYLHDPSSEAPRIRGRVLAALLADARVAVAARDRMAAIDLLDRVLALDDGNAEALKLVSQLDRAVRMRFVVRASCAALGVVALGGVWVLNAPKSGAVSTPRALEERVAVAPSAKTEPGAGSDAAVNAVSASAPEGTQANQQPAAGQLESATNKPTSNNPALAARPRESRPRTVVFDPSPANVSISVDGAEPRHYGPSFRMVELSPGPHRFSFVGAHDCCKALSFERDIPSGPGETVVTAKLEFRDGYVYVDSVPADVVLDDGLVKGRSLFMLAVPVKQRLVERHRISVTAPGYGTYTGNVEVRAGVVTPYPVSLTPRAAH
ncbi:MAG: Serine/threonine protein kinase PrkC, regulator of stationary phase [Myxococcaceae bacterium]|nr:Serine/threonine protein kinase PrkC, regulator of stationary phase [Myxococcaceae bacterium]